MGLQRELALLPLLPLQQQLALQGGSLLPLALEGCIPGGCSRTMSRERLVAT